MEVSIYVHMNSIDEERRQRRAEAKRRYSQSEKGRQVHKAAMQRYMASDLGKQAQQRALAKYKAKTRNTALASQTNSLRVEGEDIDKQVDT